MDFRATVRVVIRRWYVVLPVLLIALAGVAAMYRSAPVQFQSNAVLLLHSPATGGTQYANGFQPDKTNPLLNSGRGLDLAGTVLIQAMQTTSFTNLIAVPDDNSTTYSVNNGTDNPELVTNGPFVFITVTSSSPQAAQDLVRRAVAAARSELGRRQAMLGAPPSTFVEMTEIIPASDPAPLRGGGLRAAAAALALGMLLALSSAFACESLVHAREVRRREAVRGPTGAADRATRVRSASGSGRR
jgi:hypothetical protein